MLADESTTLTLEGLASVYYWLDAFDGRCQFDEVMPGISIDKWIARRPRGRSARYPTSRRSRRSRRNRRGGARSAKDGPGLGEGPGAPRRDSCRVEPQEGRSR
jgi:hypothetical protein